MKRMKKFTRPLTPTVTLYRHADGTTAVSAYDGSCGILIPLPGRKYSGLPVALSLADGLLIASTTGDITHAAGNVSAGGISVSALGTEPIIAPIMPGGRPVARSSLALAATCADATSGTAYACVHLAGGYAEATDTKRAVRVPLTGEAWTPTLLPVRCLDAIKLTATTIATTDQHVFFGNGSEYTWADIGNYMKFPDFNRVFNVDATPVATIASAGLLAAIDKAKVIADTAQKLVTMRLSLDSLALYATGESGQAGATMAVARRSGGDACKSFNYTFLRDVARAGDTIEWRTSKEWYPDTFVAGEGVQYVVMPMVSNGGKESDVPADLPTVDVDTPRKSAKQARKSKPPLVEVVPGHVWASHEMADEVTQALRKWGMIE